MSRSAPFTNARQGFHQQHNGDKDLDPGGSYAAFALALIAAILLIFAASAMNATHAWEMGAADSLFRASVLAAASVGAAVLAPLAFLVVHRGRGFGTKATALLVAIGALAFTSVSSLGFVAKTRDSGISDRLVASDKYGDQRAVAASARAELATLKGKTKAVIDRRRELMALLAAPPPAGPSAVKPVQADAQASALAAYIRAAGYAVSDASVSVWLSLATVLSLEAFAALSLTVAAALKPIRHRPLPAPVAPVLPLGPMTLAPAEMAATAPETTAAVAVKPDGAKPSAAKGDKGDDPPPPSSRKGGKPGRPRDVTPAAAVAKIKAAGGRVQGSVNGIGKMVGTKSRTTAHRLLTELRDMGLVEWQTGPRGCVVALV